MARGNVSRGTASRNRRKWVWARCRKQYLVAPDNPTNLGLLADFQSEYGAQLLGATIMAIRGTIFTRANPPDTVLSATRVVHGIRVYTESVESPFPDLTSSGADDVHADWMWWHPVHLNSLPDTQYAAERFELDVGSSRRMEELGQGLMLSTYHDISATSIQVQADLSIGLKLP